MATFEEIGKYIDEFINQEFKSKDELKKPKLAWTQCAPRTFYKCIQLTRENAEQVVLWLIQTARFEDVNVTEEGIHTEYGEVLWSDWIIQEPHEAVVFMDKYEYEKQYIYNG